MELNLNRHFEITDVTNLLAGKTLTAPKGIVFRTGRYCRDKKRTLAGPFYKYFS